MPCFKPLKGYKDPTSGGLTFNKKGTAQTLEVACGQCLGCRVDHRIMWAIRIIHESYMHVDNYGNSWVTLTYRDACQCTKKQFKNRHYLPEKGSLTPSHVSKFIRKLRKQNPQKIRYFYCGEYGELGRPHYHVCLFNHSFHDQQLFKDDEGLYTYTSPSLEKLWPYGFSTCTELNFQTANYTAGYAAKKITGKKAAEHYLRCDENGEAYWLLPEFIRMSTGNKNPPCGLGAKFYAQFESDIFPRDSTPVPGHGTVHLVPRYYQNILKSEHPDTLELVKSLRKSFYDSHRDDFTPERLHDKYINARAKQNLQKRTLQ